MDALEKLDGKVTNELEESKWILDSKEKPEQGVTIIRSHRVDRQFRCVRKDL